jgi:hypothetical protein
MTHADFQSAIGEWPQPGAVVQRAITLDPVQRVTSVSAALASSAPAIWARGALAAALLHPLPDGPSKTITSRAESVDPGLLSARTTLLLVDLVRARAAIFGRVDPRQHDGDLSMRNVIGRA